MRARHAVLNGCEALHRRAAHVEALVHSGACAQACTATLRCARVALAVRDVRPLSRHPAVLPRGVRACGVVRGARIRTASLRRMLATHHKNIA